MRFTSLVLLGFTLILQACQSATPHPRVPDSMVGKIYGAKEKGFISQDQLFKKLLVHDIIYLGEKHDNKAHHDLQWSILMELTLQNKKPLIAFELFDQGTTSLLLRYQSMRNKNSTMDSAKAEKWLRKQLQWEDQDENQWQGYFKLIEFARKNNLTLFGADLPRSLANRITNPGPEHLTALEKRAWKDSNYQNPNYQTLMFDKFKEAHCGWSDPKLMAGLYRTWLSRNDAIADAIVTMRQANPKQPIVVILGGGHTEHDLAVFERVNNLNPKLKQLNIGLQEVDVKPAPIESYLNIQTIGKTTFGPSHQYYWFTGRQSYVDPCEKYKKQLQKHQPKNKQKQNKKIKAKHP